MGLAAAALEEKRRRLDVMAHVYTYGVVAPQAAGIRRGHRCMLRVGYGWSGGVCFPLDEFVGITSHER